jgi:hypothetical protein
MVRNDGLRDPLAVCEHPTVGRQRIEAERRRVPAQELELLERHVGLLEVADHVQLRAAYGEDAHTAGDLARNGNPFELGDTSKRAGGGVRIGHVRVEEHHRPEMPREHVDLRRREHDFAEPRPDEGDVDEPDRMALAIGDGQRHRVLGRRGRVEIRHRSCREPEKNASTFDWSAGATGAGAIRYAVTDSD